jgi:hypothetical protein
MTDFLLPWSMTIPSTGGQLALLMAPHAVDGRPLALGIRAETIESPSGARLIAKDPAPSSERHVLEFITTSWAEFQFLRDFYDTAEGMRGGFWFPTWHEDIALAPYFDGGIGHRALWFMRAGGYADNLFPLGIAYRRFLALYSYQYELLRATAVTPNDPAASGFDQVAVTADAISAPAGITAPTPWTESDGVLVMAMRYGRFDQDEFLAEQLNIDGQFRVTLSLIDVAADLT